MKKTEAGSFGIEIIREFPSPREDVFDQWSDPQQVKTWFAPDSFHVTRCEFVPEQGRSWRVDYTNGDNDYSESGLFLEVDRPSRLTLTLTQRGYGSPASETVIEVLFDEIQSGTRMTLRQSGFGDHKQRDDHVVGWGQCFDKLEAVLKIAQGDM
jgi:uncharacterized protein YndB with AHSA1/START domain